MSKSDIKLTKNITIIEPIGYLEMVYLIKNSKLIMTDSGGLQKEAYFFEKQCITLRDETEWVELIECKANILVGADKRKILEAYKNNSTFNINLTPHHPKTHQSPSLSWRFHLLCFFLKAFFLT